MISDLFKKSRRQASSVGENVVDKSVGKPNSESPIKSSSDEMLIQSIKNFRDEMRNVAAKVVTEHEQSLVEAKKRIEYAEKFVKETGINRSLLLMLEEMWHWPSWCKREDFAKHKNVDVSEVSGEEIKSDKKDTKRIYFSYGGEYYRFEFDEEKGYFDQFKFGAIRLYQNDKLVLSMKVSHNLDEDNEYYDWNYMNVDGLETGSWVGHVVEIEEKIRIAKGKFLKDLEANRILDQAKNLPKGE